ncbi:Uncharacterised protein [Bordetella pertussis]|nr:Uncharacterised protein [Bordetella pertussis]
MPAHVGIADFGHRAASGTYHQQVVRFAGRVVAGAPCVDRVQAVDQAFVHQEIERAIDRGRRRAGMFGAHRLEQLVRLEAAAVDQQQLQHFAADGRQPPAALRTEGFGQIELGADGIGAGRARGGHNGQKA